MPKNTKYRRRTEQRFEYRIAKKLTEQGWLVLNCTKSYPFDLVAIKWNRPVILELKSRFTSYPDRQREYQREMCNKTGNGYVTVNQLFERNKHGFKISIEDYKNPPSIFNMILQSLSNFLY